MYPTILFMVYKLYEMHEGCVQLPCPCANALMTVQGFCSQCRAVTYVVTMCCTITVWVVHCACDVSQGVHLVCPDMCGSVALFSTLIWWALALATL